MGNDHRMPRFEAFSERAFNQVPDSENRIHSDEVAREHGFRGGLVPGVTVSAYLLHPAVVSWGSDFLERGAAHVTVQKPVYDDAPFRVSIVHESGDAYDAELLDESGTRCAVASCSLTAGLPSPPVRRGDPPAGAERAPATREGLELLQRRGMGAVKVTWGAGAPMTRYFRDEQKMPELLRISGGGFANSAFLLGTTNWLLAANVDLGPWLHLETWSQNWRAVSNGDTLVVEGRVLDLFERKGHRFVDVDAGIFFDDSAPAARVRLRAIYKLRA